MPFRARSRLMLSCAAAGWLSVAGWAGAGTITVTQLGENGPGSIRDAIAQANLNPGPDTIVFNAPMVSNFTLLRTPLPTITGDLTIIGPNPQYLLTRDTINPGTPDFPILTISGSPTVEIRSMTISAGRGTSGGGIVAAGGSLTLTGVTITGCTASGMGGGVYMRSPGPASLTITRSTIVNNRAFDSGAGVAFIVDSGAGTLNILDSTIGRNTVTAKSAGKLGGGLFFSGPGPHAAAITNSTIFDNAISLAGAGGGLHMDSGGGTLALSNCTISGNLAGLGGAVSVQGTLTAFASCTVFANNSTMSDAAGVVRNTSGTLISRNTILSGNISGGLLRDLADAQPISGPSNLIGVGGSIASGVDGNIVGVTDPRLVPMGDNGGPTMTFALRPGSPAIDAGSLTGFPSVDQRGQPRPADGDNDGASRVDIGAFETQRYLVVNTADSGPGSLRDALLINNTAGGGFVKFAIPALGQVRTITPVSPLPTIARTVFLDAWSQGGNAYQGPPLIEISGSGTLQGVGIDVQANDCVIRGLAIGGFAGTADSSVGVGLRLTGRAAIRNWIYGNIIGLAADGLTPRPNAQAGVWLGPSANSNLVGSNADGIDDTVEPNVIAGSTLGVGSGVYVQSNSNVIAGNIIGLNAAATAAVPNATGVSIAAGTSNRVGSLALSASPTSERNIISGNTAFGVNLSSQGSNNSIAGNYIGIGPDGATPRPNGVGVQLDDVTLSLVGGASGPVTRNVISGNASHGVLVRGAMALGNSLWGNFIGTDASGLAPVPNAGAGVRVTAGASFTRVGNLGDASPGDDQLGNVVSANLGPGVEIISAPGSPATASNSVRGNIIGLSATGMMPLGNRLAGVRIADSASNQIGSTLTGRNIIGGSTDAAAGVGVEITGPGSALNTVVNNRIGISAMDADRGNTAGGVLISAGASYNTIGGTLAGEGNTIAHNDGPGVRVLGDASVGNALLGNSIFLNDGLGIDLAGDGVTPSAPALVVRVGPNNLQNAPLLTGVGSSGPILGTLTGKASTSYRVELFGSPQRDPSGSGEGRTRLAALTVTTGAAGTASFSVPVAPSSSEPWISATATEITAASVAVAGQSVPPGTPASTSEFSLARIINTAPSATPAVVSGVEDTDLTIMLSGSDADTSDVLSFRVTTLPGVGQLLQFGTLTPITAGDAVADATGRVVFRPAPGGFGTSYDSFRFSATDGLATSPPAQVSISIAPAADTPAVTDATTTQSTQTTSGLVITRNPTDGPEVTHFRITAITSGRLFQNNGVSEIASGQFITAAQAAAGLRFTPDDRFVGTASFNIQASLSASMSGLGGGLATARIVVLPRAFTPSITPATTREDTQSTSGLVITRSTLNGPEVTHFRVSGLTTGSLFLADGVTAVADGAFITAAQAAAGLRFTPAADFSGPASFTVESSLSATVTGLGGAPATASITVTPVADTPSITDASTRRNTQTTSGLVITRSPVDGPEVTHFRISSIASGRVFLPDGLTEVPSGSFVTAAQGAAGLRFTPVAGFDGQASFRVEASIGATPSGVGGSPVTARITVLAVAVTPSVTGTTTPEDTQSTTGLVITPGPGDAGVTTHYQITSLTTGTLLLADGTTPVPAGAFITAAQGAAGLRFTPPANSFGPASFRVQAASGPTVADLGGDTVTASITVTPVADTPAITGASTFEGVPTASGLVITRNPADSDEVSHFKIISVAGGSLRLSDGLTPVAPGAFITAAQAAAGLRFVPDAGFSGDGSVTIRAAIGATDSGLGGSTAVATVLVRPVNQPPTFVAADPPARIQGNTTTTISNWAGGFNPGRPSESTQTLVEYIVDNVSPPGFFTQPPSITPAGTLTYTPAISAVGSATFRVRVRDSGGTEGGGRDTSDPATFTIRLLPAALCRDVTIDARTACASRTVSAAQINATPSSSPAPEIRFSRSLSEPFPIGTTQVTITLTYPGGLTTSCTARVTVLGTDCNANGQPDACDITSGIDSDCNANGVPDSCECAWDNGSYPAAQGATANGQLSHEGVAAGGGVKTVDDFYLRPGAMHRILSFRGQMLTNTLPIVRKARLEIYEDCNGAPASTPLRTFSNSQIISTSPAGDGFDLVTFAFNLCAEQFWLEGGKTYFASLVGVTDSTGDDLSFWVTTTPNNNAPGIMGRPPFKRFGAMGTTWNSIVYGPWQSAEDCCGGCANLSFSIAAEECKIVWDNGPPDLNPATAGGSPSGADGPTLPPPRTVDNFVIAPCSDVTVCLIEATIFTNCDPLVGFAELYANQCSSPTQTPIATAQATRVVPLGVSAMVNGQSLPGYTLQFTNPGWTLQAGRTYWLSAGSSANGSASRRSVFAFAKPPCESGSCTSTISPGRVWRPSLPGVPFADTGREFAFRLAVRSAPPAPAPVQAPPVCRADIDRNSVVNLDDMFIFLSRWFLGCP